ncbi:hypothetical protein AYI69_g7257 [Smittium culicis]|uniref:Uncharacterized protein n=1 Tax=Smittium culicis TaxID=133412 RepID=A0A1R1XTK9_9FUNG|nr:hypothetical protein AYI69_g7257 [Smittium culicis]
MLTKVLASSVLWTSLARKTPMTDKIQHILAVSSLVALSGLNSYTLLVQKDTVNGIIPETLCFEETPLIFQAIKNQYLFSESDDSPLFGSEVTVDAYSIIAKDTERNPKAGDKATDFQIGVTNFILTHSLRTFFMICDIRFHGEHTSSFELKYILACDGVQDPEYVCGLTKIPHSESLESLKIFSSKFCGKNERPLNENSWFSKTTDFGTRISCPLSTYRNDIRSGVEVVFDENSTEGRIYVLDDLDTGEGEWGFMMGIMNTLSTMIQAHRLSVFLDHADFNTDSRPTTNGLFWVSNVTLCRVRVLSRKNSTSYEVLLLTSAVVVAVVLSTVAELLLCGSFGTVLSRRLRKGRNRCPLIVGFLEMRAFNSSWRIIGVYSDSTS